MMLEANGPRNRETSNQSFLFLQTWRWRVYGVAASEHSSLVLCFFSVFSLAFGVSSFPYSWSILEWTGGKGGTKREKLTAYGLV